MLEIENMPRNNNDKMNHGKEDYRNPMEGKRVVFVEDSNDKENADGVRGQDRKSVV